jgi:hypothetical protein
MVISYSPAFSGTEMTSSTRWPRFRMASTRRSMSTMRVSLQDSVPVSTLPTKVRRGAAVGEFLGIWWGYRGVYRGSFQVR